MTAYKALWIDGSNRAWSLMKGSWTFFRESNMYAKHPLSYPKDGRIVKARDDMKPYLFAFATLDDTLTAIQNEFQGHFHGSKFKPLKYLYRRGHIEVWEVQVEEAKLNFDEQHSQVARSSQVYDDFVFKSAPAGTVFCSSVQLVKKVTNLKKFKNKKT